MLRANVSAELPRFLGAAKYVDLRSEPLNEDRYLELLQDIHGIESTPKPPLGRNPFTGTPAPHVASNVREDPARYLSPALTGSVSSFDYTNNNGRYAIGAGNREFTVQFAQSGHGSIYLLNDPADIRTIALAPNVANPEEVGDASRYDGSSRHRTIKVGDAGILRNHDDYWAAVFIDQVLIRETSPNRTPSVSFRYHIPAVPDPVFSCGLTAA